MYRSLFIVLFTLTIFSTSAQKVYEYHIAPKDSTINTYFNTTILDPYQWMENPSDPRLEVWLEAQKKLTSKQGHKQTNKEVLRGQLGSMFYDGNTETKNGYVKTKEDSINRYEFSYKASERNQVPDLLYRVKGSGNNYRYLVKAKDFRIGKDDNVFITNRIISPNQNLIAIVMMHNGSDWRNVYFFDLVSGKQLPDTLNYLRNGSNIIWDETGVYYDRYSKPEEGRELLDKAKGQALYYHKIGTTQSEDKMLYMNPDLEGTNRFTYFKNDSTKFIFNHFLKSRGVVYKAISYAPINPDKSFFLKNFLLYPNSDSIRFNVEEVLGDTVYLRSTWGAPNGKVIRTDINQLNKMEEFVPEFDVPLRSVERLGKDKIACSYRNNGQYKVLIYNLKGELLKSIDFPIGKSVNYFFEKNPNAEYANFCVSSFYHPDIWYQLSLKDLTFKPSHTIWVPYDAKDIETRYVKYKSKDGTIIPMYITCKKSTKLDGKNPTLIYGYGGYGVTIEPKFDESKTLFLLHGGILAVPSIRGGGSEGSDWGLAGRRLKKQNTIDDFIAAAEYLINEKYSNPEKLAISGGSHGGLLVGATITQRPELFKAAIAEAGAFDMLRFENYTVGSTNVNISEFGTVTDYNDFCNLKSYSPLHNIKDGVEYPNVLLITGDNDDRVPPFHSYKLLATLQERGNSKSLYQIYFVPGSGHGGALTSTDWTNKILFENYFLFNQLGIKL